MSRFLRRVVVLVLFLAPTPALAHSPSVALASWYSDSLRGSPMKNGRAYNPRDCTIAANRTLPIGTRILVRDMHGKSLVLVVQDRGPYVRRHGKLVRARNLDVSRCVAEFFGFTERGTMRLMVTVLPGELPEPGS